MRTKAQVAFLQDGSFFPLRNGTVYSIHGLMNALADLDNVSPNLVLRYRGWDNPKDFTGQKFRTIFTPAGDDFGLAFRRALTFHDIEYIHIYNAEEVVECAKHLNGLDIKIIYEAVNIDHVLYARLGGSAQTTQEMKQRQAQAMKMADYVMCRSEIDMHHIVAMGIKPQKIRVYRGAIDTSAITFRGSRPPTFRLVFLGHMYYPPNENALKLLAEIVLPELKKLDPKYTITVIGIAPPQLIKEYSRPGLEFRGGIDNLSEELQKYDIAVAPVFEGSGTRLKLLDFMASGLPTVTTSLGIEGLQNDIEKVMFIEDDIHRYAQVIHHISSPSFDHDKIVRRARRYVESNYDWRKNLTPFEEIYFDHG